VRLFEITRVTMVRVYAMPPSPAERLTAPRIMPGRGAAARVKPAGNHLKRLKATAAEAEAGDYTDVTDLSDDEYLRVAFG